MKRPIAALPLPDVRPGPPATPPPVFMMVRPAELLVDEAYQRELSDASARLIRKIVAEFDWRKWKAPTVVETDEGFVVLDGQHSLIAAATHPDVDEVPVLVVQATEVHEQAEAFVGINTTRLGITAAQLHHASVAAGNEAARAVDRVCAAAGIKVLRLPPARAVYKAGETIAVAALSAMVGRQGEKPAIRILRVLAGVGYGPVAAAHIRAVEHLLADPEFAELDGDDLGRIIASVGIEAAERDAKIFASTHCIPLWRALAATWFKARKVVRRRPGEQDGKPQGGCESFERKSPSEPEKPQPSQDVARVNRPADYAQEITRPDRPGHAAAVCAARAAVPAPNFSGRKAR